jgi:hypothetical protein
MSGEPFPDLANAKFSLGDGFGDEFVGRNSLQLKIVAVDPQKGIGRSQADSLIAIEKSMVAGERLHQGRGFVNEVVVVPILGTENGCFEKALIANTVEPTKFVYELSMRLDGLGHSQVNVARRDVLFLSHGSYLARS